MAGARRSMTSAPEPGLFIAFGSAIGIAIGVSFGGGPGIALGMALGAGAGVVVGAVYQAMHRR